jgi:hypothetical protein
LNESGANYAKDLIAGGYINWGPFAWDSDADGEQLLDEEGENCLEHYSLGIDAEVVGTGRYHYPFGKDGEVYIEALVAAQKEGGLVADYATKLLSDIAEMKAQAKANTTGGRGRGMVASGTFCGASTVI